MQTGWPTITSTEKAQAVQLFITKSLMILGLLAAVLLLTACATPSRPDRVSFTPVAPPVQQVMPATNGSIYQASTSLSLFEDLSARRVGDILTVKLEEKTEAAKKAGTTVDKKTNLSVLQPKLFGIPMTVNGNPIQDASVGSAHDMAGAGDSSQSNKLQGNITVTVAQVQPNGNLVIQGEKWITINQGDEYIQLSGIVRPVDISADNTISSTKVANAQILYSGKGVVADANKPGWLARFFFSAWSPF